MKKKPTGTREWATTNVNIALGCEHNCRYCYARTNALRFKRIQSTDEWPKMVVLKNKIKRPYGKRKGTIMFPTTHDITPKILDGSIIVLGKMLKSDNRVLIVSKPHAECIKKICDELESYKELILFRFTIGSYDNNILKFWEPNAPRIEERIGALKYAFDKGYNTSVSCEPLLGDDPIRLFYLLKPHVTDSVWLGGLNRHEQRVDKTGWGNTEYEFLHKALETKTRKRVLSYYKELKDEPLVKWKDSFKKILGIESPSDIGMDV